MTETASKPKKASAPDPYAAGQLSIIADLGEVALFSVKVFRSLPGALRYPTEILRQVGILILSSAPVIWFMLVLLACELALESHYLTAALGISSYAAVIDSVGFVIDSPEMWGWVLAAKVGCGLVAELGSMRISEEIDALEVMGINPMPYLVGTRVLAIAIFTPFMYLFGAASMFLVARFMGVYFYGTVSPGGHHQVFWSFISSTDIFVAFCSWVVIGTIIVLVGCYYGYTASGGPVGVGHNTAKSMIINMIVVSVIGALCWQLFVGGYARIPISN